jgi:hypothetical protein
LRDLIRKHKSLLLTHLDSNNVACCSCAAAIPAGTTLCTSCGSKRSPLIPYAIELGTLTEERTLRGAALVALDRRHFPRLVLAGGQSVGPGLLAWCPVLRDLDTTGLRALVALIDESKHHAGAAEREL